MFELNLENFQKRNRIFDDVYLKKAIVFFESYLAGSDFKVTKLEENNLFQIDFYSKFIYVNLFSLNIDKKVSIILNGNKFKIKNDKYHSKLDGSVSYNIPFGYVIGLTNLISLGSY